jgi:hypothetical protein
MKEQVSISILAYARPTLIVECRRAMRVLAAAFIVLHPFLVHTGVFITWLCASTTLRRPPRPSLDDPKMIGGIVDVAYVASALPLMCWPVVAFLSVLLMTVLFNRVRHVALLSAAMAVAYLLAYALLQWDPGGIVCWYMD